MFQIEHSSLIMNEGMLKSPLVDDVFCSNLILITICSSFVFMFVRGGRWIFSTVPVCDVKSKKSITSWYLYFLLCEMKQKERHWKSFAVVEDRICLYSYVHNLFNKQFFIALLLHTTTNNQNTNEA